MELHGGHDGAAAGGRDPGEGRPEPRASTIFSGTAEPGAVVAVAVAEKTATAHADAKGAWRVVAKLPEAASARP